MSKVKQVGDGYELTVSVSRDQIEKAIARSGKLDSWKLESLIHRMIDKELTGLIKKQGLDLKTMVKTAVDETDWNAIVRKYVDCKLENQQYD